MDNHLKAVSKGADEIVVENYIVLFGGKDLSGDFFTKNTKFDSGYTDIGTLYVDFEHGQDVDGIGNDDSQILGVVDWKSAKFDEKGIFVRRVLNRRASYVEYLSELINAGVVGTSSEAVRGKVQRKSSGEIVYWPLKRDSLTVTPMEPRMVSTNVLAAAKSLATFFPENKSLSILAGERKPEPSKSIEDLFTLSEAEDYLKSLGMSGTQAVAFISRIKRFGSGNPSESADGHGPGDPGDDDMKQLIDAVRRRGEAFR
jgi:phage head maturation protease